MGERGVIKGLGEFALRVNDLERMAVFYETVVGLNPWRRMEGIVFFRIADGYGGHTQIVALFDRSGQDPESPRAEYSTLDHFAFEIDLSDYQSERERLEGLGVSVRTREFPHFGWRGLFFEDPEGNTVEFVCYDEGVRSDRE